MCTLRSQGRSTCGLVPTLEERADPPPARDAALVGVLSQRRLQEEQRHATREHEEDVRDEENAWEGATVGAEGRGKVSFIFNIGLFFSSSKWKSVTKKTRIQPRLLMFGTKRKTNLSNHPPQCLQQKLTGSMLNIRAARQPESLETVVKNLSLHFHNNHYVFWWHTMIWMINTVVPVTAL